MTVLAPPDVTGRVSRSAPEIARVLDRVRAKQITVTAYIADILFQSVLRLVDARGQRIIVERSPVPVANAALLSRPRCTFHSEIPAWHLEFVAAAPRITTHEGKAAIQCRFPEVLVSYQRRGNLRIELKPPLPLRVLADAEGIMPFEARIVDIALGGIGFLVYSQNITLEPGTLLLGCRIQLPGGTVCLADLEVRYSQPVTLPSGKHAMRSGCRFVSATPQLVKFARLYLQRK